MLGEAHTRFLYQKMGKWLEQITGGAWVTLAVEDVRESAGVQSTATYIGSRQGMVDQWEELRLIFKLLTREKSSEGVWISRDSW